MEGGKALRQHVFMYMVCKCQHVSVVHVMLLLCFTSLVRLFLFSPLWKQIAHTYLFVSWFISHCYVIFVVMQFPCCWNDWSDQQNKRTEILQ